MHVRKPHHAVRSWTFDPDAPLTAAYLDEGRPVVLAQTDPRYGGPRRTVPLTVSELRRVIDTERGYIDDPRDRPSLVDDFPLSHMPAQRFGGNMQGIGATLTHVSPFIPAYQRPVRLAPVAGLGESLDGSDATAGAAMVGAGALVLVIGLGAVAGRAMAPRDSDKSLYTVAGGAAGIFGPLGLGLLGLLSLASRK